MEFFRTRNRQRPCLIEGWKTGMSVAIELLNAKTYSGQLGENSQLRPIVVRKFARFAI